VLADDGLITIDDLPREVLKAAHESPTGASMAIDDDLASIERAHVIAVLKKEKGNKARAARSLGIHRRKLYRLIERFQIDVDHLV